MILLGLLFFVFLCFILIFNYKKKGFILILLLIFFILLYQFFISKSSVLINSVFVPKDINSFDSYDFLIDQANKIEFEVVHKYRGNYALTLLVENPVEVFHKYEKELLSNIFISINLKEYKSIDIHDITETWGDIPYSHGIYLLKYKIPKLANINQPVFFSVKIDKLNSSFNDKYGNTKIKVLKISDI